MRSERKNKMQSKCRAGADCMAGVNFELVVKENAIFGKKVCSSVPDKPAGILQLLTAQTPHGQNILEELPVPGHVQLE